jgi:Xaa-Pro aminopeptidase
MACAATPAARQGIAMTTTERQWLFSTEEYGQRLEAVRQAMRRRGLDVVVIDESENLFYVAGWHASGSRYHACVVPLDGDPVMLLRRIDEPAFLERTWLHDHVAFDDTQDPIAVLATAVRQRGWGRARIGLETDSHFLPVQRYEAIKGALPSATFGDFAGVLWELRLRKSPQEIAYVRHAAQIADRAMADAIGAAREGQSEREVAALAAATFLRLGADSGRTGPITSGPRSGSLHGSLANRRLERGDILHMELAPTVNGYGARLMRPTAVGVASREQETAARRLVRIQDEQIAAMKPGAVARDVDRICRAQVLAEGLRETYENFTGYTLGYYGGFYSAPRTSDFTRTFLPTADWVLEPGMCFHMYTTARGMAFSETVVVTDRGAERLTQLDRKLFVGGMAP